MSQKHATFEERTDLGKAAKSLMETMVWENYELRVKNDKDSG